jgi:hypothetical protein
VEIRRKLTGGVCLLGVLSMAHVASAQTTSSGDLTVTATVASSISMTFETDGSGVTLTGAGSSSATLGFGTVSAYGTIATANVSRTVDGTAYTVSTPFGVKVVQANSSSTTYTLQAALASSDATNTWTLNSTALSTSSQSLGTTYAYGSAVSHTMKLTVPFTASTGALSRVVDFTATAN